MDYLPSDADRWIESNYPAEGKEEKKMGNWRIVIEGIGPHHNGERAVEVFDADFMARQVTDVLARNGHTIVSSVFEVGQRGTVARVVESAEFIPNTSERIDNNAVTPDEKRWYGPAMTVNGLKYFRGWHPPDSGATP